LSQIDALRVLGRAVTRFALLHTDAPADAQNGDAELVMSVRSGDTRAWNALYARHAPWVRCVLARMLGVSGEVDDALQECFYRLARDVASLREPAALRGFLRAIAVGVARRSLRTRARKRWLHFFAP
jgi:DNA-directed RNA polymerase specialized sigma24 family protein